MTSISLAIYLHIECYHEQNLLKEKRNYMELRQTLWVGGDIYLLLHKLLNVQTKLGDL